ncbi:MAG: NAD-dependent succinate-semialdehyde dehydrogenase [Loigolactobacillus coryniformis]|jgi:succinate-semialdehyde dehydrogenase/glutarate-semialdehyde dehydrogenase|uniref:Succinate-semialdehyde dehydrogenase (NADP+) n=1 Tax=Loigolactobacillus coryniformis subsp. coryniformis KCTC 3167 = DSM 20001 TaxID=913848 RepID=A0A0R1F9W6_9LACO|nr:NAD-dependent succinate-semialdehyde dehydrogenase [Loigolactobacillus coryniformis]ATO54175.1 succinate-semialdehyde dehydrogenase [Loigolactobacillus coryniformis subsp. coryniformis KCTC 3167 = DSM 20001]KRK16010.1 succinate-semialdehyde dehydrogenase (NADP+) [Loigolactobacillus coryniformis subsp. coryniformis KCTC 3167 = DSM 20001]MDN5953328.1 NAD-dependent succinate-semialdehyde dehydrogenase [Loigolactobacillus coryniformis]OEH90943.1 succinate-semialdehyde dehydrogenase [Loigolactoba
MAYQSINPYSNEVLKTYPDATDAELEQALAAGDKLYHQWRNDPISTRAPYLKKVADLLRAEKQELATIMTKEMGKLLSEAEGEVDLCASIVDYYADHAVDLLKPVPLKTDAGNAYYAKQATGVIFAVEPWNFPLYQIVRVFAPNFMVGNPMILKHASNTPGSADAFDKLVQKAGAPAGSFKNLFVSYDQVAKAIADPRVTGVALTGSERGGSSVAKVAGENLKKSTMELGGNDAFIVLDDADFDLVKKVSPQARLYNAGQVCTSSKRFIVTAKYYDEFLENLKAGFAAVKPGDPLDKKTTLAPLSSQRAKEKLVGQVKKAVAAGAKVYYGNEPIDLPGQFFPPTILTDVTKDNPIYNEEMFGPVAVVYKVENDAEAIALANDSSYGLGGSVFSKDPRHAAYVAEQIETGMSFVNSGWLSLPELPFGGVKNSGYGRELSDLGLNAFVNEHLVINATDK